MMNSSEWPELRHFYVSSLTIPWPEDTGPGFVDLYEIDMVQISRNSSHFLPYLSQKEHARAEKMVNQESRAFSVCSHGIRREILSRYLNINPVSISFHENIYGKPDINNQNPDALSFNVSHSKDRLIIGISMNREIGVDIQGIDDTVQVNKIAQRVFSKNDLDCLIQNKNESLRTFYRIWTAREAYSKAVGMGFSLPYQDYPDFSNLKESAVIFGGERVWYLFRIAEMGEYECCVIVSDLNNRDLREAPDSLLSRI